MKKAFTLIELVIVIVIISILLGVMSFFSWSYITHLNVQNEKETVLNTFFLSQTMSLSQPTFWSIKDVKYIWVKIEPNKDYIEQVVFTWTSPIVTKILPFSYVKMWTWIKIYNWWTLEKQTTNPVFILYKPYKIGSFLMEDMWWTYDILTWDYNIKLDFKSIYSDNLCFMLNLLSWRLYSVNCN